MSKTVGWAIAGAVLLLVAVPVLAAQVAPHEGRQLLGVELEDAVYQEIAFPNPEQGIDLAGMLFLPAGDGPFPAAVIIHGAGTSRRDNTWYLYLASYLQSQGIAVLLPDKRGSESSGGDWRTASFPDLATDTRAAVDYLKENYPDRVSGIGVVGLSQGGQVAPIVASRSGDLAYVVNAVGSATTFDQALIYEENHNLREMGFLPGISNLIAYGSAFVLQNVTQKGFWDAIGDWDPLPYWQQVEIPALVLYGDIDSNTPSRASAARLNALGKPNLQVVIFEGSGHPLEDPVGHGDRIWRLDALERIRDFILEATQSR